jgi:hypothetical protein
MQKARQITTISKSDKKYQKIHWNSTIQAWGDHLQASTSKNIPRHAIRTNIEKETWATKGDERCFGKKTILEIYAMAELMKMKWMNKQTI